MTYNVFGGTLNPTLLYSWLKLISCTELELVFSKAVSLVIFWLLIHFELL